MHATISVAKESVKKKQSTRAFPSRRTFPRAERKIAFSLRREKTIRVSAEIAMR